MRTHAPLRRALIAALAATALTVGVGIPAASASPAATSGGVLMASSITPEQQVIDLINARRASAGLPALVAYGSLSRPAEEWSTHLAASGTFVHSSSQWRYDRTSRWGWQGTGENLAAGYATAKAAVDGWMASPGHKANILNKSYTGIGLGYVQGGPYGHYWTAVFGVARPPMTGGTAPVLKGSTAVGGTVSSRTSGWPSGTTLSYQWYAGTTAIPGATKPSIPVITAYVGKQLKLRIKASNPNYFPSTVWSGYTLAVRQAT